MDTASAQLVAVTQQLGATVGRLSAGLNAAQKTLAELVALAAEVPVSALAAVATPPAAATPRAADMMLQATPLESPQGEPAAAPNAFGALRVSSVTSSPTMSLSNVTAEALYLLIVDKKGALPNLNPGDSTRAKLVKSWFDAMATPVETAALTPGREIGSRRVVAHGLANLVCERLRAEFRKVDNKAVPTSLQPITARKPLIAGAIETQITSLRVKIKASLAAGTLATAVEPKPNAAEFQKWRLERDALAAPASKKSRSNPSLAASSSSSGSSSSSSSMPTAAAAGGATAPPSA
jgi:hypothetical protein